MGSTRKPFFERLHPIVVRELRQVTRSQGMQWLLMLFLLAQLLWLGWFLSTTEASDPDAAVGRECATVQLLILGIVATLGVPAYAAVRLGIEARDQSLDLVRITGLTMGSLFSGKIKSALLMYLLIASVSLPFATVSFLMRGVGWDAVLLASIYNAIVVVFCLPYWMSAAVLPRTLVQAIITLIIFGGWFFIVLSQVLMTTAMLIQGLGVLAMLGSLVVLLFTLVLPAAIAFGVAVRRIEGTGRVYRPYGQARLDYPLPGGGPPPLPAGREATT
jgi:hypothetical protein